MENKRESTLLTTFLGIFWLLDGILQFQPKMFSFAFINNILKINLQGQPSIIASWISFGIHMFSLNMGIANLLSALLQVAIGLLLILPVSHAWKKFALWTSIPWCLMVWVFGEGLGNIFTGSASFYTGAPGSVMLYLLLACSLLSPDILPMSYLPQAAGVLFYLGGLLNASPMFWINGMQTMLWQMSQQDTISFITHPARVLAPLLTSTGTTNIFAIAIPILLGILLLVKPTKLLGWITLAFLFIVWWVSQDFGGIFTFPFGTATDPNSAPIFALFLLPLFMHSPLEKNQQTQTGIDYTKWFIASMLVIVALLGSFILARINIPVNTSGNGINTMNMR